MGNSFWFTWMPSRSSTGEARANPVSMVGRWCTSFSIFTCEITGRCGRLSLTSSFLLVFNCNSGKWNFSCTSDESWSSGSWTVGIFSSLPSDSKGCLSFAGNCRSGIGGRSTVGMANSADCWICPLVMLTSGLSKDGSGTSGLGKSTFGTRSGSLSCRWASRNGLFAVKSRSTGGRSRPGVFDLRSLWRKTDANRPGFFSFFSFFTFGAFSFFFFELFVGKVKDPFVLESLMSTLGMVAVAVSVVMMDWIWGFSGISLDTVNSSVESFTSDNGGESSMSLVRIWRGKSVISSVFSVVSHFFFDIDLNVFDTGRFNRTRNIVGVRLGQWIVVFHYYWRHRLARW